MKRELIVVMALMCCSAHSVRLTLRERNVIQQINNPIYSFFVPINRNHISALNCIFQTRLQYQLRTPLECDYHELDEAARNLTDKLISQTTKNPNCIDNFLSLQFLLENPTVLGGRESEITELLRRLKDTGNMYAAALLCIHRSQRIFGMDHDKEQFQTYTNRIDEVFPIIQTLLETLFETLDENEMAYCTENIALMDLAYAGREWDSDDISVEPRISVRLAEHIERLLKQLLSNLTPNNEMLFKKLTTDQTRYPDAFIGKIHRLIAKHADAGDIKAIKLHYGFSSDWQDEMPDEEAAEIRRLNLMLIDVTRFKDSAKFVQLLELSNGYFIEPFRQRTFQAGIVDNALKTVLDSPSEQSLHVLRFIMKYPKLAIQIEAMKYRIMRILKILEGDGYIDATKLIYEWTHDWNAMPQEMAEKLNRIVVVNNRDEFEHNRESIQNDLRGIDETYAREIRKLTVDFFANFPDPDESPGFYIKSKSRRQAEAPTFKFPIRRDFLGDYSIPTIGSTWPFYTNYGYGSKCGWKIHISAVPSSALQVASVVIPILNERKVEYKAMLSLEAMRTCFYGARCDYDLYRMNKMNDNRVIAVAQRGKFIVIYPKNEREANELANEIDQVFTANSLTGSEFFVPCVGEIQLGETGGIFARWCKSYVDDGDDNITRMLPFIDIRSPNTIKYMNVINRTINKEHPFDLNLYYLGEELGKRINDWGFHQRITFEDMGLIDLLERWPSVLELRTELYSAPKRLQPLRKPNAC